MEFIDDRLSDFLPPGAVFFARRMSLPREPEGGPDDDVYVRRDYYDAMIYLRGEGTHEVVDATGRIRTDHVRPGYIYLWRPQDLRALVPRYGRDGATIIQVGFDSAEWRTFAALVGIDAGRIFEPARLVAKVAADDHAVTETFENAVRAFEQDPSMWELVRFWCEIMPRLVGEARGPYLPSATPPWLLGSVDAMREEENLRLGMARFRELTHVSDRHLARSTHRYYGMSPNDLLAELRLRHATLLLGSTFESISGIAERCGYASPKYFSDRFRRAMGVAPREYRARSWAGFPSPDE
jgi:AraC-like DNA-binding protein